MPTKKQVRRKRAARRVAPPRKPDTNVQIAQAPAEVGQRPVARRSRVPGTIEGVAALARHDRFPAVALGLVFVASWAIWGWVTTQHPYPNLFPDEMLYGKLSQNFASGDGLQWRGSNAGLPPLWPLLLSIGWRLGSVPDSWEVMKFLCAGLASVVVFPVYFLARSLAGKRRAVVAALLSVAGAWMSVTTFIVTENIVYPIATASLAAMVVALRRTSIRWFGVALGLAVLATAFRTQMLVLPVVAVIALLIDVLRRPRGEWRGQFEAWPRALWIGLGVAVVALLGAFILRPGLTNYDLLAHHASVGQVLATSGRHAATSIVAVGFVPVAILFALMLDRANWRDERTGPLLVVIAASVIVLFPVLGRFEAWATAGSPVERYTMYLAPLLAVAVVLAPGRLTLRRTAAGAALMVLALLGVDATRNFIEQPALFGLQRRLDALGGFPADHTTIAIMIVAALVAVPAVLALNSKHVYRGLGIVVGLTLGVMLVQSVTFEHNLIRGERLSRHLLAGKTLDWVDRAADGPVAMLAIGKGEPMHQNVDLYTDFFNRKIKSLYSTEPVGASECQLDIKARGYFQKTGGYCLPWPRNFVLLERQVHITLWNETIVKKTKLNGWLIRTPPGEPRILGLVKPPCTVDGCSGEMQLGFYLDQPGTVRVTFGGTPQAHRVRTGNQIETMPAGRPTTITFKMPAGDHGANLPVDWTTPDGPPLLGVAVTTSGKTVRVY